MWAAVQLSVQKGGPGPSRSAVTPCSWRDPARDGTGGPPASRPLHDSSARSLSRVARPWSHPPCGKVEKPRLPGFRSRPTCPPPGRHLCTAWLSPGPTSRPSPSRGTGGKGRSPRKGNFAQVLGFRNRAQHLTEQLSPGASHTRPVPRAGGGRERRQPAKAETHSLGRVLVVGTGTTPRPTGLGTDLFPPASARLSLCSARRARPSTICGGGPRSSASQMRKQAHRGRLPALGPPTHRSWARTQVPLALSPGPLERLSRSPMRCPASGWSEEAPGAGARPGLNGSSVPARQLCTPPPPQAWSGSLRLGWWQL